MGGRDAGGDRLGPLSSTGELGLSEAGSLSEVDEGLGESLFGHAIGDVECGSAGATWGHGAITQ
jgi:hypothetical protein